MPYLEFVMCEKCGHPLNVDPGATIRAYYEEGRRDKDNFINPATIIWDYLMYSCVHCGQFYKFKFRDIERKVREYFSNRSEEFRDYFDKLDVIDFDEMGRVTSFVSPGALKQKTLRRLEARYQKK